MNLLAQVPFVGPEVQWFDLSPLLVLLAAAILLLLAGALTPTWPHCFVTNCRGASTSTNG